MSCGKEELTKNIEGKLKNFYEEELNVQLVIFDSVLDHILRIDRVLKQPIGHLLLVGASGVGKTTLSRFVAWLNNLTVFQIKAGRNYSVQDFDDDLRAVMKRAGCKGEKICFIFGFLIFAPIFNFNSNLSPVPRSGLKRQTSRGAPARPAVRRQCRPHAGPDSLPHWLLWLC